MNNENKTRIRTAWTMICVMILTMFFGTESTAHAQMQESIVYNKNILYINKYINIVNIKNIINIDYINNNINKSKKFYYLINDFTSRNTFLMPEYKMQINLKSRVDNRVIISRLANAIMLQETGGAGAYTRKSYSSSACGAFQYMTETWNDFMGYKNPCSAPSWVQDLRMAGELKASYAKYNNWQMAVAAHLSPARAGNMKTWSLPMRGNPTVGQYVASVFKKANITV